VWTEVETVKVSVINLNHQCDEFRNTILWLTDQLSEMKKNPKKSMSLGNKRCFLYCRGLGQDQDGNLIDPRTIQGIPQEF